MCDSSDRIFWSDMAISEKYQGSDICMTHWLDIGEIEKDEDKDVMFSGLELQNWMMKGKVQTLLYRCLEDGRKIS